jgi:predicted acetyltransferase
MPIEIRAVEAGEVEQLLQADRRGFGQAPAPSEMPRNWAEGELDRTRVALDGDQIVGVSRNYSFELTMPGGGFVPAAAVSWVAVVPTHRRRGVLTQMMAALHDDARARAEPVSMLTASESVIYSRYGYGVATWRLGLSVERARAHFGPGAPGGGRMRMLEREDAEKVLPAVYEQIRPLRPGAVSRPDFWWPSVFWGNFAGKDKAFFAAVHSDDAGNDDGYVAYEIDGEWNDGLPDRRLLVWDMQARSGAAHVALWRYLLGVDLVATVSVTNAPIDDPLRYVVTDGRRVRVDFVNDGLSVAPLDPAPVLAARTYSVPGRLVLAVHEPGGPRRVLALDGGPDGAQCVPSTDEPDLECTTAMLGACVLGGTRWSELAYAERVAARDAAVLTRADAMFACAPAPAMLSYF